MKKFSVYIFSCKEAKSDIVRIGNGMKNAAAYYTEKYSDGVFYLFVPKEYGDITTKLDDKENVFWSTSSLLLLMPGKEIVNLKGYRNLAVSKEDRAIIIDYINKEVEPFNKESVFVKDTFGK
jgi:hypothetical protein